MVLKPKIASLPRLASMQGRPGDDGHGLRHAGQSRRTIARHHAQLSKVYS
jgi:hypothetical protein